MKCFLVVLMIVLCRSVAEDDKGFGKLLDRKWGPLTRTFNSSEEENPCYFIEPPEPDFTALGRRISETKCVEYIWEIKKRADRAVRLQKCSEWRKQTNNYDTFSAVGGHDTVEGEYPHMGAVGWKAAVGTWIFKCGSTLIDRKHLLTAAHCSRASSRDTTLANIVPQIVRLGDKNIADVVYNYIHPYDMTIKNIIVHPSYNAPKKYFDIAIIEITSEVIFSKLIQPACLWTKHDVSQLGNRANLTGWGVVETAGWTTSPELQAAEVEIIDSNYCDELLRPTCNRHWCGINSHQLCAGNLTGGVDTCQGDSGGPLQVRIPLPISSQGALHYVIGVTSFGVGCARPNSPGVYTRVSSFIDWIEEVVWRSQNYALSTEHSLADDTA